MKKILVFILLLMFVFIGCKEKEVDKIVINSIKVVLNEDKIEVSLGLNVGNYSIENINKIGVIYGIESENQPLTISTSVEKNEVDFSLNDRKYNFTFTDFSEELFNTTFKVKVYLLLKEDEMLFLDKTTSFNLYELAKDKESDYAKYVVNYVDGRIIDEIKIKADYKKYTVEALGDGYDVKLETDYDKINITITFKPNYIINDDFIFIVNDKTIDPSEYQFINNTIEYEIDDPNWTRPY